MRHYTGRIDHNAQTICKMYKAEYSVYGTKRMAFRFLAGMILAAIGLIGNLPMALQSILLLAGCWLAVSRDFPAKCRADRALENRKQELPVMRYQFEEDRIILDGEGHMEIPYNRIKCLAEEDGYLYFFLGKGSGCMIDRKTLRPEKQEAFLAFLEEKTGLSWRKNTPWFMMSLSELAERLKAPK